LQISNFEKSDFFFLSQFERQIFNMELITLYTAILTGLDSLVSFPFTTISHCWLAYPVMMSFKDGENVSFKSEGMYNVYYVEIRTNRKNCQNCQSIYCQMKFKIRSKSYIFKKIYNFFLSSLLNQQINDQWPHDDPDTYSLFPEVIGFQSWRRWSKQEYCPFFNRNLEFYFYN
jgi:hypothetical protein